MRDLNELANIFGKDRSYFSTMKYTNPDKYNMVLGFDYNYYKSVNMYKDFIITVFFEAGEIERCLSKNELIEVLVAIGVKPYNGFQRVFTDLIHQVIDEDNFLSIPFMMVIKVIRFIQMCNMIGYSNYDIGVDV